MFKSVQAVLVTALLAVSGTANAFDDNRTGFFIGLGVGFQGIQDQATVGAESFSESDAGVSTSFKVGGGITDQFALYYVRNASWYSADVSLNQSLVFASGISGIGATYYLQPTAPSAYVLAAVGLGDYSTPFAQNANDEYGSATMFGAGYEFSNHRMIEATMLFVDVEDDSSRYQSSQNSFQITLNHLWY